MDMLVATLAGLGLLAAGKAYFGPADDKSDPSPGAESDDEDARRDDARREAGRFGDEGRGGRDEPRLPRESSRRTAKRLRGVMTPARQDYFERSMRLKAPREHFEKIASIFDKQGLGVEAEMLRRRGRAREAAPEVHDKRREVIRKAFESGDPDVMERVADVAETKLGMTISAGKLREVALGIRQARGVAQGDGSAHGEGASFGMDGPLGGAPGFGGSPGATEGTNGKWLKPCPLNAGGECIVHGVGGCVVEAKSGAIPPPVESVMNDDPGAFDRSPSGWGAGG
jgi:hypothetical protein